MSLDYLQVHSFLGKKVFEFGQARGYPTIIKGLPRPNLEGVTDWMRFTLLAGRPYADPQAYVRWEVEVAITSLKAHLRTDQSFDAPYRIAREIRSILHRASYALPGGCLRAKESSVTHLDNRTVGSNFEDAAVTSPDSNTHTILIYTPFIEISKED